MSRRVRLGSSWIIIVIALAAISVQCQRIIAPSERQNVAKADEPAASFATTAANFPVESVNATAIMPVELSTLAENDPVGFLRHCIDRYEKADIEDYTCTFRKQELVQNKLGKIETVKIRFREHPYSVDMHWVENAKSAERGLYVKGAMVDSKGRELAWFKPDGSILQLVVPKVKQPIHGERARKAARRSMDQFGFRNTLGIIMQYVQIADERDELRLEYVGEASIDGRMTWVFERRLPYDGDEERYPDALLRYHIDQEWMVPTACYSYADHHGSRLLGSYELTDVSWNVGLTDDDFNIEKIDF